MIIKHIMHSRERCFSYCHKNIKGEKHELKQKMKGGGRRAKIGVRSGGSIPSVLTDSAVPWDVWGSLVTAEELHQQKKNPKR